MLRGILLILAIFLGISSCTDLTQNDEHYQPKNEVSWSEAVRILNEGDVVGVSQSHSLWVEFELRDGSRFASKEPEIDYVFWEIEKCEACGEMYFLTE